MSLGRLLSAGKALTSLRDIPTAYQVRRKAMLPKFGLGGDPFASAKAPTLPTLEAKPEGKPEARPATQVSARSSFWPCKWPGTEKPTTTAGGPRLTRAARKANGSVPVPVQAELSLDNVKVVRNDLRDADVDLVTRGGGSSGLLLGAAAAHRAEEALDRLADRIVGVQPR